MNVAPFTVHFLRHSRSNVENTRLDAAPLQQKLHVSVNSLRCVNVMRLMNHLNPVTCLIRSN